MWEGWTSYQNHPRPMQVQCPFCFKKFTFRGGSIANHIWKSAYCCQKKQRVLSRILERKKTTSHVPILILELWGHWLRLRCWLHQVMWAMTWHVAVITVILGDYLVLIVRIPFFLLVELSTLLALVEMTISYLQENIEFNGTKRLRALSSLTASRPYGNIFKDKKKRGSLMCQGKPLVWGG